MPRRAAGSVRRELYERGPGNDATAVITLIRKLAVVEGHLQVTADELEGSKQLVTQLQAEKDHADKEVEDLYGQLAQLTAELKRLEVSTGVALGEDTGSVAAGVSRPSSPSHRRLETTLRVEAPAFAPLPAPHRVPMRTRLLDGGVGGRLSDGGVSGHPASVTSGGHPASGVGARFSYSGAGGRLSGSGGYMTSVTSGRYPANGADGRLLDSGGYMTCGGPSACGAGGRLGLAKL